MVFAPSSAITFWSFLLVDQMEAMDIPEFFKQLWNKWDIRILILLSLFIQIILISLGRLRKTSTSIKIRICLWSSYLLTDWVADFTLGRLSGKMVGSASSSNAIFAFWAPFLILHLGGPDTITAYAMEDNELWLRHLLALCYELFAAFYVLFRSLPNTYLLAPTILIFFVGIIKYVERIYSLYKASTKIFRSSIGSANILAKTCFSSTKSNIEALKTLKERFKLYTAIKPCFADIAIRMQKHDEAWSFVLTMQSMEPKKILEVMNTELSYAYDEIYTKAIVNHSRAGYVLRALCSICIWLAFLLYVLAPNTSLDKVDMAITYVLLSASIFLDATAVIMLLFSDWMVLSLLNVEKLGQGHWTELLAMHIVKIKSEWLKRRSWSSEMPQLNLISSCLMDIETKKAPWRRRMMNWIEKKLGLVQETKLFPGSFGDDIIYTLIALQPIKATQELQEIIVEYAQRHFSKVLPDSPFQRVGIVSSLDSPFDVSSLVQSIEEFSLDEQVVVWHIVTELCFHLKSEYQHSQHSPQIMIETKDNKSRVEGKISKKDACKYLSNYMMHMLVMRPEMMSTMGGNNPALSWWDYDAMFTFIYERGINGQLFVANAKVEDVCRVMMAKDTIIPNNDSLKTAKMLASQILLIEEEKIWENITTAWVKLLIKGGESSRANMHLKQLSKGGELLTLAWLLSKHAIR